MHLVIAVYSLNRQTEVYTLAEVIIHRIQLPQSAIQKEEKAISYQLSAAIKGS